METKICVCCGKVLPISSFGKNRRSSDGLMVECKECTNKKVRASRERRKSAGVRMVKTNEDGRNPELAKFHPRELIAELKARGYSGEIYYTQKTVF